MLTEINYEKCDDKNECYPLYEFHDFIDDETNQLLIDLIDKVGSRQYIMEHNEISKMIENIIFRYIDEGKFQAYRYINDDEIYDNGTKKEKDSKRYLENLSKKYNISNIDEKNIDKTKKRWRFIGCNPSVTLSRHQAPYKINIHKDTPYHNENIKNLAKLIIYLNDDPENINSGGTIFMDKNKRPVVTLKREKYKAGLFDIRQWHTGQKLKNGTKYLLGLRLMYIED